MRARLLGLFKMLFVNVLSAFVFSSCYQAHSDDDLRTVPVTNNPHVVPSSGSGAFSGIGY